MTYRQCTHCGQVIPSSQLAQHLQTVHGQRNGSTRAWRQLRQQILQRDHRQCVICGQRATAERPLQIHHADMDATNDNPANLETRCITHNPSGASQREHAHQAATRSCNATISRLN